MREREFIDWICRQSRFDPKVVPVGPGDDCAIVSLGGEQILVTTDQVLDGVHFILAEHGAKAGGRKALARNLSDIAAMAAIPLAAVASVSLPQDASRQLAEDIYAGLRQIADEVHCPVVGGDVAVWNGPLAISVTVLGRRAGVSDGIEPVLRSGAKANDAICVTGSLGGAWRSSRHLEFTPRIAEAICLALNYGIRSMIDLSDGLATDLNHICDASGVGAEILAESIPVHEDALRLCSDEQAALQAALTDGEDYELLFTLPGGKAKKLCQAQPLPIPVTRIGRIVAGEGVSLVYPDGRTERMGSCGWEHKT